MRGPDTEVELIFNDNEASLRIGVTTYSFRLIDGEFPDYRRVIPAAVVHELCFNLGDLSGMVRRLNAPVSRS